jgi:hypothetical protein
MFGPFFVSTVSGSRAASRLLYSLRLATDGPCQDSLTCWDRGSEAPQKPVNLAALFVYVASLGPYAKGGVLWFGSDLPSGFELRVDSENPSRGSAHAGPTPTITDVKVSAAIACEF